MKLSLLEIRNLVIPLQKLSVCDMPIKTSWKLLKISEQIEKINQTIEKFRTNLVLKYGTEVFPCEIGEEKVELTKEKVEEYRSKLSRIGDPITKVMPDKLEEFSKEFNLLLTQQEEIVSEPFKIEDFSESTQLSPQDLYYLKGLFETE